ncbi:MAG: hypothetical protein H7Z43_03705, partial [Clostridia bacterium]|nr:hypothetical protein [Deltaproteobacteria bacterium]
AESRTDAGATPTAQRATERSTRTILEDVARATVDVINAGERATASPAIVGSRARTDVGNNETGGEAAVKANDRESKTDDAARTDAGVTATAQRAKEEKRERASTVVPTGDAERAPEVNEDHAPTSGSGVSAGSRRVAGTPRTTAD